MKQILFAFSLLFLFSCNKDNNSGTIVKNESADWMSILLENNPSATITFRDICMPGSHDAGMFLVQDCSVGANSCNTQTQYLDFKGQLEGGIRVFDVRPIFYKNRYYTQHATDCDGLGCKGDRMENILAQTKAFLDKHAEVVIYQMVHFCKMNPNDEAFIDFLEAQLGDRIYRDNNPSVPLIEKSLRDILRADMKTGKIILMFENGFANTPENRAKGYFSNEAMPSEGGWSNKNNFTELKADQLAKYNAYNPSSGKLFSFSWQMTQDALQAVNCALRPNGYSIQSMAKETNANLPLVVDSLIASGSLSSSKFPNVIWTDDSDASITKVCVKISELAVK